MHGLVRCKHERRCSRACGADVSFRDVTIKIPDRRYDQGCEWRHAPEAWAEIWEKSVSWVLASAEEDVWLSELPKALHRLSHVVVVVVVVVVGGQMENSSLKDDISLPYVEKPFNSKVIKSFIPELRSGQVFFVFRDSYDIYMCVMDIKNVLRTGMNKSISHIHVWLCNMYANKWLTLNRIITVR